MNRETCHLVQWARDVTELHGLKHVVYDGSMLRRFLWLLCFCGSLGGFCLFSIQLLKAFYQRHHVTMVDVVAADYLAFPSVTVCNINKYKMSAFTTEDITNVGYYLGIVDKEQNLINPHLYTDDFIRTLESVNWTENVDYENYNMTDFTIRTGHQLEDLIQSCKWKGEDCASDEFVLSLTHLGVCYTFNKYTDSSRFPARNATIAGSANGLQLILDIEEIEYTPTNDLDAGAMDAGVKIMLHRPTEPPYIKELGFAIAPGLHSFVQMRNEKITSVPAPYTECEVDRPTEYFDHYSLQACRIECETRAVVSSCGCRLPEQPGNARVCNPVETHECAHIHLLKAIEGDKNCSCQSPCDVENYPKTLSVSRIRAGFFSKLYQDTINRTEEHIEQNIAVVSIYYEALNYEDINQIPAMTITMLLASMGGNMGLFLGGSLLTVIQIIEYFFDETVGCFRSSKKERAKEKASGDHETNEYATQEYHRGGDNHTCQMELQ